MISIIIPILRIPPYDTQIEVLLKCLERQTAEHEVIVSEQAKTKYIKKNALLNKGFEQSKGEYIWHCDADFLPNRRLLQRMKDRLEEENLDVIFPMFYSHMNKSWRICDGGPFMRREVLERHGPLNGSLKGINFVTFPFLEWCLANTRYLCSQEFKLAINHKPFIKPSRDKIHPRTRLQLREKAMYLMMRLIAEELLPASILRGRIIYANHNKTANL